MNASEKFKLFEGCKVRSLRPKCAILMHYEFFRCKRNVLRGLEEHLVKASFEDAEKHDYINGECVYEVTNVEGHIVYVRFEPGWAILGSQIIV